MSETRKNYFIKLFGRIVIFIICSILCYVKPESYEILNGMNFFKEISPFHLLWLIWIFDMLWQIVPANEELKISIGSQKLFASRFKPIREKISKEKLKNHIANITKSAYMVFVIWGILTAIIGGLYYFGIINKMCVFMISVFFYVCDLICVLIWCPFRLIMKNKCCITCRIFNWDHLMMFIPLIFIGGFYGLTLVAFSILTWGVWELCILLYPERFTEKTNAALKCSNCTDKLCTQYCGRKKK